MGCRGRPGEVGSNDWGEQGGAGGREVREGGEALLGQQGDQAQGPICSSAPAPQTCTPMPLPLTPHQPDDGASPGPQVHAFTAPTSLERQRRTSEQALGPWCQTDPSALQLCDLWASYGPRFPPLQKSLPHRAHMKLGSVRACRGGEDDCRHTMFGLLHTSLCPHSLCRDPRSLHALSHFIQGSP